MASWKLLLVCAATTGLAWAQPNEIEVRLDDTKAWTPWVGAAAKEKAEQFSHTFGDGYATFRASGGGGVMVWGLRPEAPFDVSRMRFLSMRYRLTNTDNTLGSYLLYLSSDTAGRMYARNLALGANDLIHDGEWHTATTTLNDYGGQIASAALRFRALEGREGRLDVASLRFTREPPRNALKAVLDWQPGEAGLAGEAVPLASLLATDLAEAQKALDLSDWFGAERVTVHGVNFAVATAGKVALSTSRKEKQRVA
ncbi:MAG: hypothetical protein FJ279_21680, partial [Planctomycetes bacterium]|nr:hypothetical protein [Planctomycetota bacterium]